MRALIDDPHETVQFRTPDRLRPAIPGRQAVAQHLAHRLSGQSEASRRRTLAQPFHIDAAPYLSIELHSIHPSCVPRNTIGMLGGPLERSGFPPPSGDADHRSVVYFCSAVLKIRREKYRLSLKERKRDTRRKILAGSWVLSIAENDQAAALRLRKGLDEFLERERDRELFGLSPRPLDAAPSSS